MSSISPKKTGKIFTPVIATANDLATGAVVFRDASGAWLRTPRTAYVARDAASAAQLQISAQADASANRIVDLALIPACGEDGAVRPLQLREIIRADGPTIRPPGNPPIRLEREKV